MNRLIFVLAFLVIAAGFAGGGIYLFDRVTRAPVVASAPKQPVPAPKAEAVDLTAALAFSPFGSELTNEAPAADLPRPDVKLVGIVEAGAASLVFLKNNAATAPYRLGDDVAAGYAIDDIRSASVVLTNGTDEFALGFDVEELERVPVASAKNAAPFQTAAHRAITDVPKDPKTFDEYYAYWRHRIQRNPQEVLDSIGLVPVEDGYLIVRQQNIGVRLAGFRTGDVITSVNGLSVGDARQDRKNFDVVAASGLARVEILRDGAPVTFTFPLR